MQTKKKKSYTEKRKKTERSVMKHSHTHIAKCVWNGKNNAIVYNLCVDVYRSAIRTQ